MANAGELRRRPGLPVLPGNPACAAVGPAHHLRYCGTHRLRGIVARLQGQYDGPVPAEPDAGVYRHFVLLGRSQTQLRTNDGPSGNWVIPLAHARVDGVDWIYGYSGASYLLVRRRASGGSWESLGQTDVGQIWAVPAGLLVAPKTGTAQVKLVNPATGALISTPIGAYNSGAEVRLSGSAASLRRDCLAVGPGQEVVVCEYGSQTLGAGRRIFYSADGGRTFRVVYDMESDVRGSWQLQAVGSYSNGQTTLVVADTGGVGLTAAVADGLALEYSSAEYPICRVVSSNTVAVIGNATGLPTETPITIRKFRWHHFHAACWWPELGRYLFSAGDMTFPRAAHLLGWSPGELRPVELIAPWELADIRPLCFLACGPDLLAGADGAGAIFRFRAAQPLSISAANTALEACIGSGWGSRSSVAALARVGDIYLAGQWIEDSADDFRPEAKLLCAASPHGPWGVLDAIDGADAILSIIPVPDAGKVFVGFQGRSGYLAHGYAELPYPATATVPAIQLEPARTNGWSTGWPNYSTKHEWNYSTGVSSITVEQSGGPDGGSCTKVVVDPRSDTNAELWAILHDPGVALNASYQACVYIKTDATLLITAYTTFGAPSANRSPIGIRHVISPGRWQLVRCAPRWIWQPGSVSDADKPGICLVVDKLGLARGAAIWLGHPWLQRTPASGTLGVGGSRPASDYRLVWESANYWTEILHFSPWTPIWLMLPESAEFGPAAEDLEIWRIESESAPDAAMIALAMHWGTRAVLTAQGSSSGRFTCSIGTFRSQYVGAFCTVHKNELPALGMNHYRITAVAADGSYVDTTAGSGATQYAAGSHIWVSYPMLVLTVYTDEAGEETLVSGRVRGLDGAPIGVAIGRASDGKIQAYYQVGGVVYPFVHTVTGQPKTSDAHQLTGRLVSRYGGGMGVYLSHWGRAGAMSSDEIAAALRQVRYFSLQPGVLRLGG